MERSPLPPMVFAPKAKGPVVKAPAVKLPKINPLLASAPSKALSLPKPTNAKAPNILKQLGATRSAGMRELHAQGIKDAPASKSSGIPLLGTISAGLKGAAKAEADVVTGKPLLSSKGFLGKAVNEAVDLPAQSISGAVGGIKAVVDAKLGNTHPLDQIVSSTEHTVEHPIQSFKEHPVSTALLFGGAEGAVGKLAGTAARSGALGEDVAAAASTEGEKVPLYNDLTYNKSYSPDVFRKGAQKAADKFRASVVNAHPLLSSGARLNRQVYGGGLLGQWLESKGMPVQGFFKPGLVDQTASATENVRRMYGNSARSFMKEIKPSKGVEEAVPLAAEGTIRNAATAVPDLQQRLAKLQDAAQSLTGHERSLNEDKQLQIRKLLDNKTFVANPQKAIDAAKHFADWQNPLTDREIALGSLEPDQAHAKMVPYAIEHMGADYNTEPGPHPLVQANRDSKRLVNTAEKALSRAGDDEAKTSAAKDRLLDAKHARDESAASLEHLKASGRIKADGTMYPRLEVDGRPLTYDEIAAHAKEAMGDREPGFLTHKETTYGSVGNSKVAARPGIERTSRTGVAYRTGAYDSSWDALNRQAVKNATTVAGHEGRDEAIRRFGVGSYASEAEAARAADNFNHTPEGQKIEASLGKMIPVTAGPERVTLRENMPVNAVGKAIHDYGVVEHKAAQELGPEGKFRLLPEKVDQRLRQHDQLREASQGTKALQKYTSIWRKVNLFTTPRWPVGTTQENMIRLAAANVNPLAAFGLGPAHKIGENLVNDLRATATDASKTEQERFIAQSHVASIDAGMHYGSQIYNNINRSREALDPEAAAAMRAADSTTPVSVMVKGWQKWEQLVSKGLVKMERNTKMGLLGKVAMKESHAFTGQWKGLIKNEGDVIKSYADGKLNPSSSVKLTEDLFDMAGNWTNLTPSVRRAVQTYSPFGLWWLNSMKFVYRTLPWDHPIKTGVLSALISATTGKEEALPSYEKGGIAVKLPLVGDIVITPAHYSPGGIGVEPVKTALGMLLPQFSDPVMTSLGIDPLTDESPDYGTKAPEASNVTRAGADVLESTVPGVRQAFTLLKQGGSPVDTSPNPLAVKPGSKKGLASTAIKMLAPLPYQRAPKAVPKKPKTKKTSTTVSGTINVPSVTVPSVTVPSVTVPSVP